MADNATTTFDLFSKLPPALIITSLQVMKFFGHYWQLNDGNVSTAFDWPGFLEAVNGYQGSDLYPIPVRINKIVLEEANVSSMVDKIVSTFKDELNVEVSAIDTTALAANIEASNDKKPVWEGHVLFAFRQPGTDKFFYSMMSTIQLGRNTDGFSAVIDVMEFLVLKGFKDPTS
ncbi:delta-endotoxin CytB [Heliocybe sulcata]|uniref:Delta-endotoxin CytB n=1 Tax=Heliocybe sulcata TaxID=5364 RepID=A0A5C3MS91_9AGAM|nr:delta-endotoxin CytB [Heliocybe sulcata]